MFATLAGGYTRLPRGDEPDHLGNARRAAARGEFDPRGLHVIENTLIKEVVAEQEAAGLDLLTDGMVRWLDDIGSFPWTLEGCRVGADGSPRFEREPRWTRPAFVDSFRFLRLATEQQVRQVVLGPYTLALASDAGPIGRERLTMTLADALGAELRALAEAGCQVVQVDEPGAATIDTDADRTLFKAAHRRLTHAAPGLHLMLSIVGGSALRAGPLTIFDAPYQSYIVDLANHPQNWLLVAEAPGTRGMIAAVGRTAPDGDDDLDHIRWSATLLAAMRQRGPDRVGIAPAGSLDGVPRDVARRRIETLGALAVELHEQGQAGGLETDGETLAHEGLVRDWFGDIPGTGVEDAPASDQTDEDDAATE